MAPDVKLKEQLLQLLSRSTVHGISHAASASSRVEQLFWLVLVLVGVASFVGNLISLVTRYNRFPVLTSYHVNDEPFIWPDITFCDNSPVILNDSSSYGEFKRQMENIANNTSILDHRKLMNSFFDQVLTKEDELNVLLRSVALSTLSSDILGVKDPKQIIAAVAYKLHNEGIQCEINMDTMWRPLIAEEIDQFFTSTTVSLRYRCSCYTMRMNDFIYARNLGAIDSVQFFIRGNFRAYWLFNSSNYQFGGRVYIHVPSTLPEEGRMVETPPGVMTTLVLAQKRNRLMPDKRHCREAETAAEIYDYDLQQSRVYNLSYSHCHQILSQKLFYRDCNCFNPHLIIPKLNGKKPQLCFNLTEFGEVGVIANLVCLNRTAAKYRNEENFRPLLRKECAHLKTKRCNSVSWSMKSDRELYREMWAETANQAREFFIAGALRDYLQINISNANDSASSILRQGRLQISSLIVSAAKDRGDLVVEEIEYSSSQLLSDIGGLMGLYLGVSVIGLFEVMAALMLLVKYCLQICHCGSAMRCRVWSRDNSDIDANFAYRCPRWPSEVQGASQPWAISGSGCNYDNYYPSSLIKQGISTGRACE